MESSAQGFDIGVFAYIKNVRGEILIARDATRDRLWTLPGGGLAPGELLTDGVRRELQEELSVIGEVERLAGVFTQRKSPGIVALFDMRIVDGEPSPDHKETSEYGFFSLKEIEQLGHQVKPAQLSMIYHRNSVAHSEPIFSFFTMPPPNWSVGVIANDGQAG